MKKIALMIMACICVIGTIQAQVSGYGTFDLNGRSISGGLPIPVDYGVQADGRVVVNIIVNPSGEVISTSVNARTNTSNFTLRKSAEEAASKARFNVIDGEDNQSGTITYYFRLDDSSVKGECANNRYCESEVYLQKIDSLERELSEVKLQNELNMLKAELNISANNLSIKSNAILINVNSGVFHRELYRSYEGNYKASEDLVKKFQSLVEVRKMECLQRTMEYSYPENKYSTLLEVIDTALNSLKTSLDYYKICLDLYRDNL